MQLRGMTDHQKLIAEKKIGDIMYYGRMEKLTEDCFKFNNINTLKSIKESFHIPVHRPLQKAPLSNQVYRPMLQVVQQQKYLTRPKLNHEHHTHTESENNVDDHNIIVTIDYLTY